MDMTRQINRYFRWFLKERKKERKSDKFKQKRIDDGMSTFVSYLIPDPSL